MNKDSLIETTNHIDIMRLFFSICIVAIHTHLLDVLPVKINWYLMHMIFRIAVPFFFVTSGYFVGQKLHAASGNKERMIVCKNYFKKNTPPFIVWGGIGLLVYLAKLIRAERSIIILRLLRQAIFYPLGAMWFVLACMVAVGIITLFWNRKILIAIVGGGGYIFALVCNSYYFFVKGTPIQCIVDCYMKLCISARNGIFVGLIFIGMGVWLSKKNNPIKRLKTSVIIVCCFLLYAALFIEVYYTYNKLVLDDSSLFVSMPVLAVFLFELLERLKIKALNSTSTSLNARKLSSNVYYTHSAIIDALACFSTVFGMVIDNRVLFIVVVIIAVLIWLITRKSTNKFIRSILP